QCPRPLPRPATHIARSGAPVAGTVARPQAAAPWPAEEVWSFEGVDRLRVAAAEGPESIDPAQSNVPAQWHAYPAFRMPAAATLNVVERSRALANPDDNKLTLSRQVWLDFNHDGYTVTDEISGRLNRDWRLDMMPPYLLESARIINETLLVTAAPNDASGVELRDRNLHLSTIARVERARAALPATGWSTRFDGAQGNLHLPPGHRLLGAPGADFAYGSWMDRWGLWNLFGVLVVIVLAHWIAGPVVAAVAALALVLLYQEAPPVIWLWANAIAAIALFRAVPEGRLRGFAGRYRIASFVVLALVLLPLLIGQLRLAIYPQLDAPTYGFGALIERGFGGGEAMRMETPPLVYREDMQVQTESMPAAPPPPPRPAAEKAESDDGSSFREVQVTGSRILYTSVSNRYAAGTQLQAGPGVPNWQYNSYQFGWSGPVEPEQDVRFIWLGPIAMGIWRILGVLATVLFAVLLARTAFNFPLDIPGLPHTLRRALTRGGTAGTAGIVAALLLVTPADPAQAQGFPTTEMLNELRTRLTAPPACRSFCSEITSATVRANG